MGRMGALAVLAAAALCVPACYERKQTGTLNPDGSGKMVVVTEMAVPAASGPGQPKPDALSYGRQLATEFITGTIGVDAWSDVAVEAPDAGRVRITATAYFPDISKLRFDLPLQVIWAKQAGGDYTFSIVRPGTATAPTTKPKRSEAEIKQDVTEAQKNYKDQQLAMQTGLNAFRLEMRFTLPGKVKDSRILNVSEGNVVSLVLDGKKIAPVLDKFFADEKALAASLSESRENTDNDDYLLEALFGKKGPATATVTDVTDKPVFDYKTEMLTAQHNQADMLKAASVELPRLTIRMPATTRGK